MLKHGFRGVAEIENHVANTFGWSATADAVDPWIYTEISKTFLLDPDMFKRLLELNPHSVIHSRNVCSKRTIAATGIPTKKCWRNYARSLATEVDRL